MTDQIAPSLAGELEQAAKQAEGEMWVSSPTTGIVYCVECGEQRDYGSHMADCETSEFIALLTRAAALARAAENMAEPIQIDWVRGMYRCVVCGAQGTYAVTHADDCSWAAVKRLVSSEGKGE